MIYPEQKTPTGSPKAMAAALSLALAPCVISTVQAQDAARHGASALLEEVVVTARKREEGAQDVPLSVSAFNSDQLETLKVRDLTSLKVGMPNVALEDVGTTRGTANFSIRGLGINSSIPSIDPTVGVFQNGVYLGVNNGIIFDLFYIASIEVLRGPQGTLFGRNVTGGAVLMNTKKPGDELEATLRFAADQGKDGGLSAAELCEQWLDPARNSFLAVRGSREDLKTFEKEFVHHLRDDPLIRWSWEPRAGRSPAPGSHADFVRAMQVWIDADVPCS